MSTRAVSAWQRLTPLPLGKWLFSKIVCWKAPYFATIRPRIEELGAGRCKVTFRKRRAILNHLGTVHAIAMCNAAELAAGMMTDASVADDLRGIPTEMVTHYRELAKTDLVVTAEPRSVGTLPGDYLVDVTAVNSSGKIVFDAVITMRLSVKKRTQKK